MREKVLLPIGSTVSLIFEQGAFTGPTTIECTMESFYYVDELKSSGRVYSYTYPWNKRPVYEGKVVEIIMFYKHACLVHNDDC